VRNIAAFDVTQRWGTRALQRAFYSRKLEAAAKATLLGRGQLD
jgi:hypothetical protein